MASCSNNDDDEPKNNQTVETSPKNVLSQGLPAEVDGFSFNTNEKGQVTSIRDNYDSRVVTTFEYGAFKHDAIDYDVLMKTIEFYGTNDIYIQTNNQGFATRALVVAKDGYTDTWDFEYNSDGQLIRVNSSEEGDFRITYTNGDITKVVSYGEWNDGEIRHSEHVFKYTNEEHPKGIPNKGNIMVYDEGYDVELDEMELGYYAGLLGKSTKNLPLESTESTESKSPDYGESHYTDNYVYNWVLNSNGLPTELREVNIEDGDGYSYIFSWK
ncbi:MAG: DUF4595 domain-containing protein [Muribaculaceae bacterium]|nr:DUF4595 domain-containing protein [Muribaculaceae bacterium]